MKITIAIDSFKGSLSSTEAGHAVKEGILAAWPSAQITVCPLADGGEGTLSAICEALGAEIRTLEVEGPIGERVIAKWGLSKAHNTAVIEMAEAAGITLISPEKRNPLYASTYGVGEIIRHAIKEEGCRSIIIGIGGSATNDGGAGMLEALGFSFLDANEKPIPRGAQGLSVLQKIKKDEVIPELAKCHFTIACDVNNPLLGENGCSAVFGPQKGLDQDMIQDMDLWLTNYADLSEEVMQRKTRDEKGAGAAGGVGFALLTYLNAQIKAGAELVVEVLGLEEKIKECDIVITGEGRLDGQSAMGKAPIGVARLGKKHGKVTIAFSGCVGDGATLCNECGIDAFFPIIKTPMTVSEAMNKDTARKNLRDTSEQVFRLINALS